MMRKLIVMVVFMVATMCVMIGAKRYNDCVMRKAQDKVGPPPYYLLVGPIFGIQQNNCQDWGQRMRDMYWKLLEDPKVVCECREGLQIVR